MEAYTGFAEVYDLFMDNVDYDSWSSYLIGLLKRYGVDSGLVLELGCGTGTMTERMADKGYEMIGVDNSEDMLSEAKNIARQALEECRRNNVHEWGTLNNQVRDALSSYFYSRTKRSPMILPVIQEI